MSKAIKIQAPPSSPPRSPSTLTDPLRPASSAKGSKLCRNILLDGICRNDECVFQHPPPKDKDKDKADTDASSPVVANKSTLSVQHAAAPAFVPKSANVQLAGLEPPGSGQGSQVTSPTLSAATPAFVVGAGRSPTKANAQVTEGTLNRASEAFTQLSLGAAPFNPSSSSSSAPPLPDLALYPGSDLLAVDPYYPPPPLRQPLDYHLYTTPLPHITNLHPSQTPIHTFFLAPNLREELQRRSAAVVEQGGEKGPGVPEELHVYHSLSPLEGPQTGPEGKNKRVFGLGTEVWKAVCEMDGNVYVLRRVEGFKIMHDTAFSPIEAWRRIRHPNVVSVREAFTTRLFGDHSVIFAYDYHPTSRTLLTEHFVPKPPAVGKNGRLQPSDMHVPEKVLWSYITQLCNALKAIHSEGLAARMVGEPSKVLLTGRNRVRINCCGIMDVVGFDAGGKGIGQHQQQDLLSLGLLILSLTNLSLDAASHPSNIPKALEILSHRSYSTELKNVVLFLLQAGGGGGGGQGNGPKGIDEVLAMLGPRVLNELDASMNYSDLLESEMTRELENGRLVRLLCKFGFINERPEYVLFEQFDHDPRWSESGDRYILKLFRDMVFHQVDHLNKPVLDLSHVLTCLNKLDAGSPEKIMLMSRDEQSCLVVSYREIKSCVEAAFADLARGSV